MRKILKNTRYVFCGWMVLLLGMLLLSVNAQTNPNQVTLGNDLAVSFIDVGQADCILVHTPANQNILIDAGNREDFPAIRDYLRAQNVSRLDLVIATHPHEDHIGSMAQIVQNFVIGKIYMPKVSANTRTFEDLMMAIRSKGLKINAAKAGLHLNLASDVTMDFLAPNGDFYEDLNNYSAVVKLSYHKVSFLLTGDAEKISEQEILNHHYSLSANILKVGHHGSNSSSSMEFLRQVAPEIAVISVGLDNPYHHPGGSTLKRLEKVGAKIYRTDQNGTIQISTNGYQIYIHCDKR